MPVEISIPFNKPSIIDRELEYIESAIAQGQLSGDGDYTKKCHQWLQQYIGCPAALLTHSCTAALEMAAMLSDLNPGDEVIMPSFTFVSTANAVVLRGAVPVFVDIRADTLNIDENLIEQAITEKTKAIFVVHYAGVICEMNKIKEIANKYNLKLVEDAAQALGSTYHGQMAGSFGDMATFSFHETKNVISGEGGALIINDPEIVEAAEIIREKGTNRSRFFRGQVDKYTWVEKGSSYLPGELVAAFLLSQLENTDTIYQKRMQVWQYYHNFFSKLNHQNLRLPFCPEECSHNAHMYYLIFDSLEQRQSFIQYMKDNGILTPFHYIPLHSSPAGRKYTRQSGDLTQTDRVSETIVRLPLYFSLGDEINRVLEICDQYFN